MSGALVPPAPRGRALALPAAPQAVADAGPAARFAWDELFGAQLRNRHTRALYLRAVLRFLDWLGPEVGLAQVTPGMVGAYLSEREVAVTTRKAELAALRRFFDLLVTRHVAVLNPAACVRGERHQVVEGLTPEITPAQARALLASLDTATLAGLRDRALVGVLIYTGARAGAAAGLRLGHLAHDGTQHTLRFTEKGGKSREVPVRHDLERFLMEYLGEAGLLGGPADVPLFQTLAGRTGRLTGRALSGVDVCRLVKRRLKNAALPARLSPHSFRVATFTDLLEQGAALEDVQYLAGHADPRTTRLYDRRQKKVTRNLVERISI